MRFDDDTELFTAMRNRLFTAVVGDILDTMGLQHQFLPPQIRALRDDMVAIGRAMPVLEADFFASAETGGNSDISGRPFGLMFHALDSLKPNEIYVCSGASPRYAVWGELMSTRALQLKAAGAICDGYCRDSSGILALNFPTFCYGSYAQDQGPRGKVVDYGVAIEIGGIRIRPGDILFADRDGVLVVPREAEREAITLALEKAETENKVRLAIEAGMSTVEAFERFGVM
ncbi:demethylmenaquinone methyltransferase [Rhizobium freirei PRF 81]|uniref:Putative 4-hydroxy-4-methyl-2-oxoglutarate aldolase n=1 Tax=Rhizobium freirei PRF 81 TaxID=363754 RepID=N6V1C2_9HYPH|nr:RraA family protein [Rhizobium freirei]ENN86826.1 demethylmenaquinone methyltransferase [Rhizobium freirei PRF 81]